MSETIDNDKSILQNINSILGPGDTSETNNLAEENTNTTTIASDDPSFEEGDEDYDDEQEELESKNTDKEEVKEDKKVDESYLDYGGNNETNAPAK